MILLPEGEDILDVVCGDRDFWVISAAQNIAHVKPAKEGASTNLNLVTAGGVVYSFLLTEGKATPPDLKVYVTADPNIPRGEPKYLLRYPDDWPCRASCATHESHWKRRQFARRRLSPRFDSSIRRSCSLRTALRNMKKPFFVRSIWNDGDFTYIKADAHELPALYEVKDGQPSPRQFPGPAGHLRGSENPGARLSRARQRPIHIPAGAVSHGRHHSWRDTDYGSPRASTWRPATARAKPGSWSPSRWALSASSC